MGQFCHLCLNTVATHQNGLQPAQGPFYVMCSMVNCMTWPGIEPVSHSVCPDMPPSTSSSNAPISELLQLILMQVLQACLVISRPGPWAGSQPKPAVSSQAGPEPKRRLQGAYGPGFSFGKLFSTASAQAFVFMGLGCVKSRSVVFFVWNCP